MHARRILPAALGVAASGFLLLALQTEQSDAAPPTPRGGLPAAALEEQFASNLLGSKHDFTDGGRAPRDLCTPCHTPHLTSGRAPLRRADDPRHEAPTRPRSIEVAGLNDASLMCLSCHDGVVATDIDAGAHAVLWPDRAHNELPGRSRLTSHPVGTRYPANDPAYRSAAEVTADGRIQLPGGRLQCTSCHDPHNTQRVPGLLVMSNERSRLCLSCHRL